MKIFTDQDIVQWSTEQGDKIDFTKGSKVRCQLCLNMVISENKPYCTGTFMVRAQKTRTLILMPALE